MLQKISETSLLYDGCQGTFTWPGTKPSFICVVGQLPLQHGATVHRLKVFEESETLNLSDLIRLCSTLGSVHNIKYWLVDMEGDLSDYLDVFYGFCDQENIKNISLVQPVLSQRMPLALNILRRRFAQGTLTIPQESILAKKINLLDQEDPLQQRLEEKYPEVLALASIVHYMEVSPINPNPEPLEQQAPPTPWCL